MNCDIKKIIVPFILCLDGLERYQTGMVEKKRIEINQICPINATRIPIVIDQITFVRGSMLWTMESFSSYVKSDLNPLIPSVLKSINPTMLRGLNIKIKTPNIKLGANRKGIIWLCL